MRRQSDRNAEGKKAGRNKLSYEYSTVRGKAATTAVKLAREALAN